MQQFKADILSVNKKGRQIFLILTLVSGATFVLLAFFVAPIIMHLASILTFLYAAIKYYLQTRKRLLKKIVAELVIDDEKIIINQNTFLLSEIKKINLQVTGWRSYSRSEQKEHPLQNIHSGDKNFIVVASADKKVKCEFLLESAEQFYLLKQYLIKWYQQKIAITEMINKEKSYGLKISNYSEIQEFKELITNPSSQ